MFICSLKLSIIIEVPFCCRLCRSMLNLFYPKKEAILYIYFGINIPPSHIPYTIYIVYDLSAAVICIVLLSNIFLYIYSIIVLSILKVFSAYCRFHMAHVLISQLSFGDSNKRILARVSRLWNFADLNDDTKIFHTDLVLLDEMVIIYLPNPFSIFALLYQ